MNDLLMRVNRQFLLDVAGPVPAAKKARQLEIVSSTALVMPALMDRFEINTFLRIAHFVPQIGHESDSFCTTEEYASGAAYEGRADLGNTQKGDGKRFKGYGLMQNTGRANDHTFTLWMRAIDPTCPDFEQEPERLAEFPWAVWVAIWYWSTRSLNVLADRDDQLAITRKINGGTNGQPQRAAMLSRTKTLLAPGAASIVTAAQNGFPVLHRGIVAPESVECLQRLLAQIGHYHLTIDGDFGAGTESAVRAFQKSLGLTVDGLAGEKTFSGLLALLALKRGDAPWTVA